MRVASSELGACTEGRECACIGASRRKLVMLGRRIWKVQSAIAFLYKHQGSHTVTEVHPFIHKLKIALERNIGIFDLP